MHGNKQAGAEKTPSSLERESALSLKQRIQKLVDEMHTSIITKQPIDLSTPPHREITEALHHLVYEKREATELPIRYTDGSPKKGFPVRRLWLPEARLQWQSDQALAIGTLTFRHVDYDDYVDRYLIRDRETRSLSSTEIEKLAFDRMNVILNDLELEKPSFLSIYQTGLEPLIVGLYRALVEHLGKRREKGLGQLIVQPVFFVDDNGRSATGKLWG